MMKMTINNESFGLSFHYFADLVDMSRGPELRDLSVARVIDENNTTMYEGIAICNPADKFSRAIGRKMAFSRLLEQFPREQRRAAWAQFFEKFPRK